MSRSHHGSCLCGSVAYAVDAFADDMAYCHCSMCRKFHGAGSTVLASAPRDALSWTKGEPLLRAYVAPNGTTREFCSVCGSSLTFATPSHPELIEVALGTLDSPLQQRPDAHIFVGSKADWTEITDDLPQFSADRNSRRLR